MFWRQPVKIVTNFITNTQPTAMALSFASRVLVHSPDDQTEIRGIVHPIRSKCRILVSYFKPISKSYYSTQCPERLIAGHRRDTRHAFYLGAAHELH